MTPAPRSPLLPGTTIAGYSVDRLVGSGGMAEVYLAHDLAEDRRVALKVLPGEAAADPRHRERLQLEGRVLQALRHPNVCAIYEVGEADGRAFLAMEYVDGHTLSDVASRERLSVDRVIAIGRQVAAAFEEARRCHIVHRDLTANNVMVQPSGDVKVLDFGLARLLAPAARLAPRLMSPASEPGVVVGTADWMSPEQALGRDLDHRSDLFSLGVLLYWLLTGVMPFRSATRTGLFWAIVNERPTSVCERNPEVPAALGEIVARLLEKDARFRYQTAHQVWLDLGALDVDARQRTTARQTQRLWISRLAGCSLGIVMALALMPAAQGLSAVADEAIDNNSVLPASVWTGTDRLYDFAPLVVPAINPAAVAISNDGHVVYTTRQRNGRGALWVKGPGHDAPRRLASNVGQAAVGRRSRYIYFTRRGPEAGLYRVAISGTTEPERLVSGDVLAPAVSNHADQIMFARRGPQGYAVWAVPASGGSAVQITPVSLAMPPLISPDQHRMALAGPEGVMVCLMPSCTDIRQLPVTSLVAWTPDGTGLAHTGQPGGANIWITRVDDGRVSQLTRFTGEMVSSVTWSPDGRRIAVTRQRTFGDLLLLNRLQ